MTKDDIRTPALLIMGHQLRLEHELLLHRIEGIEAVMKSMERKADEQEREERTYRTETQYKLEDMEDESLREELSELEERFDDYCRDQERDKEDAVRENEKNKISTAALCEKLSKQVAILTHELNEQKKSHQRLAEQLDAAQLHAQLNAKTSHSPVATSKTAHKTMAKRMTKDTFKSEQLRPQLSSGPTAFEAEHPPGLEKLKPQLATEKRAAQLESDPTEDADYPAGLGQIIAQMRAQRSGSAAGNVNTPVLIQANKAEPGSSQRKTAQRTIDKRPSTNVHSTKDRKTKKPRTRGNPARHSSDPQGVVEDPESLLRQAHVSHKHDKDDPFVGSPKRTDHPKPVTAPGTAPPVKFRSDRIEEIAKQAKESASKSGKGRRNRMIVPNTDD